MNSLLHSPRRVLAAALSVAVGIGFAAVPGSASAVTPTQVSGSGSSWAANAVNQWAADVTQVGLQVVYTATGSAQGRRDFAHAATDFGVTDIAYQGSDPITGDNDYPCSNPADTYPGGASCRAVEYAPLVSGGVGILYRLTIKGTQVRSLRLSPDTLARIFTGQITAWNDPRIAADNPGIALPAKRVVPVVHSEGTATSLVLSQYLAKTAPSVWTATPSLYAALPPGGRAQNGSDLVAAFFNSPSSEGAIGYDEGSYAAFLGLPMARIRNAAGYYRPLTAAAVAVALSQAKTTAPGGADLSKVFTFADTRSYPISYTDYALVPTSSLDPRMTTAKRLALAQFLFYGVCDGANELSAMGYGYTAPNLVTQTLAVIQDLHAADSGVDLSGLTLANCTNRTLVSGADNPMTALPAPPACDKVGSAQCGTAPSAPRAASARAHAASAVVSWKVPVNNGGARLTYIVVASPGGRTCTTTRSSCTVTGLANRVRYRFHVRAVSAFGAGPYSPWTSTVRPLPAPTAPRSLRVGHPAAGVAVVAWLAPSSTSGLGVQRYLVRWSSNHGRSWSAWTSTSTRRSVRASGLRLHRTYEVQVVAVSTMGAGRAATATFVQNR